jgi:hypothetical protein
MPSGRLQSRLATCTGALADARAALPRDPRGVTKAMTPVDSLYDCSDRGHLLQRERQPACARARGCGESGVRGRRCSARQVAERSEEMAISARQYWGRHRSEIERPQLRRVGPAHRQRHRVSGALSATGRAAVACPRGRLPTTAGTIRGRGERRQESRQNIKTGRQTPMNPRPQTLDLRSLERRSESRNPSIQRGS